jgi:hypothetical protein
MRQIPVRPLALSTENDEEKDEEIRWKLQMRLYHQGNQKFEVEETFYEQFRIIDNTPMSLKQIKSVHSQRLNIQLMCQNKK